MKVYLKFLFYDFLSNFNTRVYVKIDKLFLFSIFNMNYIKYLFFNL